MGTGIGKYPCILCDSSDAMEIYKEDDDTYNAYCYSCDNPVNHNMLSKYDVGKELGIEKMTRTVKRRSKNKETKSKKILTKEQRLEVEESSSPKGKGYRGLNDKWNKYYGIRTEYNEKTGEPVKRYYPVLEGKTEEGKPKLVGYSVRVIDTKDFYTIGKNSKECDFDGQFRCKGDGKYLLIVGGQEDKVAAKQILEEYRSGRDNIAPIDVISPTIGENGAARQAKNHYEFLDTYENIVLNMDEDEAGQKATKQLLDVLPMGKVRIMKCPAKDACDVLEEGLENEYVRAFYNSHKPKISGIVSSCDLHQRIIESATSPLIPLPSFMKTLEDMLCGGLPTEEIVNILAGSGIGKTTYINELIYFWLFHSPYKPGVLSMEASAGKYGERLLSRHLNVNLNRMKNREEKAEFLSSDEVVEKANTLYSDENGDERFALIDDRGELDNIASVKKMVSHLVRGCGCKVIIIDPIQDLLDSLVLEEQNAFCSWQKKLKSQEGITFINVNHARKSASGQKSSSRGADLDEQDMQGTSALFKSGAVNIVLTRDKLSDDPVERNTTKVKITKNRDASETGPAGEIYYDVETHQLWDKREYEMSNSNVIGSF